MDNDFRKYNFIVLWLTTYKKQKIIKPILDREAFINAMQKYLYVTLQTDILKIILTSSVSDIEHDVVRFRKIVSAESAPDMIFVTKQKFSINLHKARVEMENRIVNLTHRDFACDKTKGPLCPKHTVMTEEEVKEFCDFHHTQPKDYPPISIYDPQCLWVDVKIGDMIKIRRVENNAAGFTIAYRFVTQRTFNMTGKKEKITAVDEEEV